MRCPRASIEDSSRGSTAPTSAARLHSHPLERFLAGVEPRESQQVADEPLHAHRVARDDLEEAPGFFRRRLVEQGFDVAANRGERRAQLVRDVGDEITADLIGAATLGDVVEHEDRAAASFARDRHRVRDEHAARVPIERHFHRRGEVAREGLRQLGGDVGLTHDLQKVLVGDRRRQPQHRSQRGVGEDEPAGAVHEHHALHHAAQDRVHVRALARHVGEAGTEVPGGLVEHRRHGADFVSAVVARRLAEITSAIAFGDPGDRADPPVEQQRRDPRQRRPLSPGPQPGPRARTGGRARRAVRRP